MNTIGPWELMMGLLLAADRLPRMAGSLGDGIGEFRGASRERGQPGSPGATQEPGTDSSPER